MNRNIFILILFSIFPLDNCCAAQSDSACKSDFYIRALSDSSFISPFIKIRYLDSNNHSIYLLAPSGLIYTFIKKNKKNITFEWYKKFMLKKYLQGEPLLYTEVGKLVTFGVDKNPFVESHSKSLKMYMDTFFIKDRGFDVKNWKHLNEIIATGFDFGLLFLLHEERVRIYYRSPCLYKGE